MTAACRFCSTPLARTFCDLGMSPLSNAFIKPGDAHRMEPFYPLHTYVCTHCFLVQLEQFETSANIFSDYVYFSSYSDTWLVHSREFAAYAVREFALKGRSGAEAGRSRQALSHKTRVDGRSPGQEVEGLDRAAAEGRPPQPDARNTARDADEGWQLPRDLPGHRRPQGRREEDTSHRRRSLAAKRARHARSSLASAPAAATRAPARVCSLAWSAVRSPRQSGVGSWAGGSTATPTRSWLTSRSASGSRVRRPSGKSGERASSRTA